MTTWTAASRFVSNRFRDRLLDESWRASPIAEVLAFHRSLPGYGPTPLRELPELAAVLGLRRLWLKDESKRFGLNAFKALGASYAIHRVVSAAAPGTSFVFSTATDGNHGRAVAWSARRLQQRAVIFVPKNMVAARRQALKKEGAEVVEVDGTYDEAVKCAARQSEANGWQIISDTAYPGYTQIPRWIMEGYGTLFHECYDQLHDRRVDSCDHPEAVVLQAGVGGLACAGALYYARRLAYATQIDAAAPASVPYLLSVEPTDADCLAESDASPDGSLTLATGHQDSIMAGLNCGTPSMLAWPVIRSWFDGFLAVNDSYAARAMRALAKPRHPDPPVVSGESGAAGVAALLAMHDDPALQSLRRHFAGKSVLVVSTEGDTDPDNYSKIVN